MLNPVQTKIAAGMNPLIAFMSEATCGEACWEAREDVCRCSCGGKNHGCMRTADGVRPTRTAKIDGYRYELKAVGACLYDEAKAINEANGPHTVDPIVQDGKVIMTYRYFWHETDKGAPARIKPANKAQVAAWPELTAYREEHPSRYPYLLWVRF